MKRTREAVALAYGKREAPVVTAKGRNRFALRLRQEALRLSIPTIADPPLARALFRSCEPGREIGAGHYEPVAEKYLLLQRQKMNAGRSVPE